MQTPNTMHATALATVMILAAGALSLWTPLTADHAREGQHQPVRALFDLSRTSGGPFPSDRFTVADPDQNTRRRVELPMPAACTAENFSECDEVRFLNLLDGFNVTPRISIPFDGDIDLSTVTSDNIFLVSLGDATAYADRDPGEHILPDSGAGKVVGINQAVWDVATHTLYFSADEMLDEHTRYALAVTRGVRDTAGNRVEPSAEFERFRGDLSGTDDGDSHY